MNVVYTLANVSCAYFLFGADLNVIAFRVGKTRLRKLIKLGLLISP